MSRTSLNIYPTQFLIVAQKDSTKVKINPTANINNGPSKNTPDTITLNKGEVYQAQAPTDEDLTGTVIQSVNSSVACDNFAVFSGNQFTSIENCGPPGASDHLTTQLYPTQRWSKSYIAAPLKTRQDYQTRILALKNNTNITINGNMVSTLNAQQFLDTLLSGANTIQANKPISVAQFCRSKSCDNTGEGDPLLMVLNGNQQMVDSTNFKLIPTKEIDEYYCTIVTKTNDTGLVQHNNSNLADSFTVVPTNPTYAYALLTLNSGYHSFSSESGLLPYYYAFGHIEAYGNAGGISYTKTSLSSSTDTTICAGDTISLKAPRGHNYAWQPSYSISDPTSKNPSAFPDTTTTYTVTIKDTTTKCIFLKSIKVKVINPATNSPDISICQNDTAIIGPFHPDTSLNYQWSPNINLSDNNIPNPIAFPDTNTTYFLQINHPLYQCTYIDTVQVNTDSTVIQAWPDTSAICKGAEKQLFVSGGIRFNWEPSSSLNCDTCRVATAQPDTSITYTVYGSSGACQDSAQSTILVYPNPTIHEREDQRFCQGNTIKLGKTPFITGGTPEYAISWHPDSGLVTPTDTPPVVQPNYTTTYHLSVTDSAGCQDHDSIYIKVLPLPDIRGFPDTSILKGGQVQLQSSGADQYYWQPDSALSCLHCSNPVASPADSTVYYVTGTDENGCQTTDTVNVWVIASCFEEEIFVPNAFTPNGDGKNDKFKVYGVEGLDIELRIYNRWGERVFKTENPAEGWNGRYHGEVQKPGVYVYHLSINCPNRPPLQRKGDVTLIR